MGSSFSPSRHIGNPPWGRCANKPARSISSFRWKRKAIETIAGQNAGLGRCIHVFCRVQCSSKVNGTCPRAASSRAFGGDPMNLDRQYAVLLRST